MIGTTVSHYRVLELLGAGGMGVVYLAEDERLHRKVALKFVLSAGVGASAQTRLLHEAQAASGLDHPNIATIYEIGEANGQSFIAMAYCPGETLKARIDRGRIPLDETADIVRQIAAGLATAHAAGIVHRDLKPANIILTPSGQVKILDFGLAKLTAPNLETVTKITGAGLTVGTLAYMPPEQAQGHEVDTRADVWSLGVVIYEMLANRTPFHAETSAALLLALLTEAPAPLARWRTDVPPELERLVSRALVKDPAERTLTAADIVGELTVPGARGLIPGPRSKARRRLVPVFVGLIAAAIAITWFVKRGADRRVAAARGALPEIQRLIDRDDYVAAAALGSKIESTLRDDPALAALWPRMTEIGSVRTDPGGADVAIRDPELHTDWRTLGGTPIDGARIPRGVLRWRFQKAGFDTVELIGNVTGRAVVGALSTSIPLTATGSVPPEMVRIPEGPLALTLTGYDYNKTIPSAAYLLDRFEVTNKDYKVFVDAGGYEKREYWTQPFVKDGVQRSFEEALAGFRDQTGRFGPATWEVGTYPQGQDDYPVGGVSWYEAVAYAQFKGQSLPTIYHWARAAGSFTASYVTPLSNFGGRGPMAVGRSQAVTQTGLYDMAGNVKEWCWNETKPGGTRYILGGSWQDPDYMFIYGDARPPFDRSATNGFRCARFDPPGPLPATRLPVPSPARNYADERPVSNEIFKVYKSLYSYDPAPLAARTDLVDDSSPNWRKEKVSYKASYGNERVPAYLFLPKNRKPPYQPILFWPGSTAVRMVSSEPLTQVDVIDFLVLSGRAVLYPVYSGTFERRADRDSTWPEPTRAYRDWVMRQVGDARRSVDYLQSRPDIRGDAIGYYGYSWGARSGSLVLGVEPRLRAAVFLSGGFSGPAPPEVDPFNFAPHVSVPVLMVNGDADFIFAVDRAQNPLFDELGAAADQKRHVVLPGGHGIIYEKRSQVIREILDWFDRYLGAVK
jgi:formylglycine-generating enzyme required for sulfatase activity/dienelactone hydrolase/predicted Ser/Thr protein kinase